MLFERVGLIDELEETGQAIEVMPDGMLRDGNAEIAAR